MITPEQNRANLRSAENVVTHELGLNPARKSEWTYEQRASYNKALAAKILEHPDRFADATLETARRVTLTPYQPLEDASFSVADFAAAYVAPIADAGKGAQAALSSLQWLVPAVVIIGAGILLFSLAKKTNAA